MNTEDAPTHAPEIGFVFRNGCIGECAVTEVWLSRFGDWKVSYRVAHGGGGHVNLDHFTEKFGTATTEPQQPQ